MYAFNNYFQAFSTASTTVSAIGNEKDGFAFPFREEMVDGILQTTGISPVVLRSETA
jgi:hypothetical protein